MITYIGNPRTLYVERRADNEAPRSLDPRLHVINHSPTGFAWGYWGSGPAQLAFALIADALVAAIDHREDRSDEWRHTAIDAAVKRASDPALYQQFKQAIVGNWPQNAPFTITDEEIRDHVEAITNAMVADHVSSLERGR